MKTFTIDEQNNITAFGSKEEAAGATGLAFSSQKELTKLSAEWPVSRLIEIWNGFAGVAPFGELKPVKKFTDRKVAVARIWQAIQRLDAEATSGPEAEAKPEPIAVAVPEPVAAIAPAAVQEPASVPESAAAPESAAVAPQVPDVTPVIATATADASAVEAPAAPKTPKRKMTAAKPEPEAAAPRESKAAQVVAMLQRSEGASINEIMRKMGWQKHTVRGFMAGTMRKAGYTVESFKPEGGERSYRISSK